MIDKENKRKELKTIDRGERDSVLLLYILWKCIIIQQNEVKHKTKLENKHINEKEEKTLFSKQLNDDDVRRET